MELSPRVCYRIVAARDARYDGLFFTCVRTTGVYCRPICPARTPKYANCLFVPTAAAAHEAGYRSCLRCRPESSPDLGAWQGTHASVSRALRLIEGGALDGGNVAALAERLGVGERQLRRLFREHVGASPIAVAQTRRVLLAKQLLFATKLPIAQVAEASGFSSQRRFNETIKQLYGRPPRALRGAAAAHGLTVTLHYRPPYDWAAMLTFLASRAIPLVERVVEGRYQRVVEQNGVLALLEVSHLEAEHALRVRLPLEQLNAVQGLIARVRHMFDLSADPHQIAQVLCQDRQLAPLVDARPGLRVPGAFSAYETAVRAVLGQQVTVAAATLLAGRFVAAFGGRGGAADSGLPAALRRPFPEPGPLEPSAVAALGMPRARAQALAALAQAAAQDPELLSPRRDLDTAVQHLRSLPGIGEWTAQYIAMRAMRECDAFPAGDVALQRALLPAGMRGAKAAKALLDRAEAWRPFRAYAVMHAWTADAGARVPLRSNHDADPCPASISPG